MQKYIEKYSHMCYNHTQENRENETNITKNTKKIFTN